MERWIWGRGINVEMTLRVSGHRGYLGIMINWVEKNVHWEASWGSGRVKLKITTPARTLTSPYTRLQDPFQKPLSQLLHLSQISTVPQESIVFLDPYPLLASFGFLLLSISHYSHETTASVSERGYRVKGGTAGAGSAAPVNRGSFFLPLLV